MLSCQRSNVDGPYPPALRTYQPALPSLLTATECIKQKSRYCWYYFKEDT